MSVRFPVFAATEYWDTSTSAGLQAGAGTWDSASSTFWSGTASGSNPLITWTDGNDATFQTGGTNTVTVSGTVQVGTLTNSSATATTISGGTIQLNSQIAAGSSSASTILTINSAIILNGANHSTLIGNNGLATLTLNGSIGETSGNEQTFRASGGSTMTLTGSNTFTGGTQIRQSGGTQELVITNASSLGAGGVGFARNGDTNTTSSLTVKLGTSGTVNQRLVMAGGTGNTAIINSSGAAAVTFAGTMQYNVAIGVTGASGQFGSNGNLDFRLGGTNTGNNIFQTDIVNSGSGGITSFTKQGSGKWILSGSNTYTGATTVAAGTLLINGSLASGSAVTVGSGAILGGSGTIGGSVTVASGGTIAPGNSPGILSTGSINLAGTLSAELGKAPIRSGSQPLAGTDYDQINVTGSVTLTGGDITLSLLSGIENGDLYFLINNDGADAVTGIFATLGGVSTDLSQGQLFTVSGQQFQISYTADFAGGSFTGGNDVALLAVPEPSSFAMLAVSGIGMLAFGYRSRRRNS